MTPVTQEEINRAKLSYSAHHACKVIPALERIIIINKHTYTYTHKFSSRREVRKAEEETRHVKAVAMKKQGSWEGEGVREKALTWQDIRTMEGHRIKFLMCSVYDVLPTP
ncbi:unnamed protein product [Leuciscus chuanchicus]